jgi:hypothetical protein
MVVVYGYRQKQYKNYLHNMLQNMPSPTNTSSRKCLLPTASYHGTKNEARLLPLDPHLQTIHELQIFMLKQLNDG